MKTLQIMLLAGLLTLGLACGYSKHNTPPSAGTMPNITELSPDNTAAGGEDFLLTVNGASFATNAKINWNGNPMTTTFVSGGKLTTTIPAAAIATSGMIPV